MIKGKFIDDIQNAYHNNHEELVNIIDNTLKKEDDRYADFINSTRIFIKYPKNNQILMINCFLTYAENQAFSQNLA